MNLNQLPPGARLTPREKQVALGVSRGLRNREIALELRIGEQSVKKHLSNVYGKLGINGRVGLALHVLRHGVENGTRAA